MRIYKFNNVFFFQQPGRVCIIVEMTKTWAELWTCLDRNSLLYEKKYPKSVGETLILTFVRWG